MGIPPPHVPDEASAGLVQDERDVSGDAFECVGVDGDDGGERLLLDEPRDEGGGKEGGVSRGESGTGGRSFPVAPAADSRESKAVGPFHAWSSSSFLLVVIGIVVLTLVAAVSSPHLLADTRTLCWYKEDAVTKLVAAVRRGACGAVG